MATDTELGARTLEEERAKSLLIRASGPDQGADSGTPKERIRLPRSVLEQFMHNLMLALGAPHT